MNFRQLLATTRVYWRTFAAVAAVVLALGLGWLVLTPVAYVSTAQLLVSVNGTTTANAYQNDSVVAGRVNSYVALVTSDVVSRRVADKLGAKTSASQVAERVTAVRVPNTAIIDITATASSAEPAQLLANTVAGEFVSYTTAIESPTGADAQKVQTTIISPASTPRSRLAERIVIACLMALAAVITALAVVWVRSASDRRVRTPWRAAAVAGAPLIGSVSVLNDAGGEDYLRLRGRLHRLHPDGGRVVLVVPAGQGTNAAAMAERLCEAYRLDDESALVLDAGSDGQDTAPLRTAVRNARESHDRVVVSGPTTAQWAEELVDLADSVVLLVRLDTTSRCDLDRQATGLRNLDAPIDGVVLETGHESPDA